MFHQLLGTESNSVWLKLVSQKGIVLCGFFFKSPQVFRYIISAGTLCSTGELLSPISVGT